MTRHEVNFEAGAAACVAPPAKVSIVTAQKHSFPLDGWRGVCALMVALFHFPVLGAVRSFPLVAHAYMFVDFFFVLSGFVIATTYDGRLGEPAAIGRFVIRRFGRLWPLHVTILAVLVTVALVKGDLGANERHSIAAVFTNLLMIQGLGLHHGPTWNAPSWSISVEFTLYLLFALLGPVPRRLGLFVALVALGVMTLAFWAPSGMASTYDFGFFRGLAGFFTGAIIARIPRRSFGFAAELAVLALVALFVGADRLTLLAPFVFALTVYVFAGSQGPVSRFLSAGVPLWLGQWSYSIYMVHALVIAGLWQVASHLGLQQVGEYLRAPGGWGDLIAIPYVLIVVGLSALTFRFIEAPSRSYFATLANRKGPAAVLQPVVAKALAAPVDGEPRRVA